MTLPHVVQFEVTGRDAARLRRFYGSRFGWQLHDTGTVGYGRILGSDAGLPGAIGPSWDGGDGQLTVYVEVPDLDQALLRAEELGGRTLPAVRDRRSPVEARGLTYVAPQAGIRFVFVADPEGHTIALCQGMRTSLQGFAAARSDQPSRSTKHQVVQFEITGRDADRLHGFYGGLFGWPLRATAGGQTSSYERTSASETGLPGAVGPARSGPNAAREPCWDGGEGQLTIYVEVDDIEGAVADAEKLGGRLASPVHEVPGRQLKLAFVTDPEGHLVGLSQGLSDAIQHAGYGS